MHDTSQAESKFIWNNYFAKNGEIGGRESPAITKYWPCIQILDITRHTSDRLGKKWKQKQTHLPSAVRNHSREFEPSTHLN